ncbi:HAMP domain-containing sensor histidine kinase [Metasolibacillus meyeri]|uniref:HAMP domain-containing sensor histidine kinase n=1 Tax=Metasolibacillus meyeri TaxID=1071052 RepID=UPI000D2F5191|nr:HAMP domain-containing histidine kinase [Metasolibacillus meyeri]
MTTYNLKRKFSDMPIKWMLTLWASFLIFVLFIAYNVVQYVFVENWMINQEKKQVEQKMSDVLNGILEREAGFTQDELPKIRSYLDKQNQNNQMIRIIDQHGNKVIAVSQGIPEEWVNPIQRTKTEITITEESGHALLVMRSPITIHAFNGTIEIIKNIDAFKKMADALLRVFILSGIGIVILSGLAGGLLARQLLRPLQSMADTMRDVESKGLQERMIVPDKEDEITALMRIFNKMMDQVELSFHRQSQFVEDASHELRTPIAIMDGHMSLLLQWGKDDPKILEESLNISYYELTRLKSLVQDLLTLTGMEKASDEPIEATLQADLRILQIISQLEQLHPQFTFETAFSGFKNREVLIAEGHLEQLMLILLDNAMKYSTAGSPISVTGSIHGDYAVFVVKDCGIGIPESDLPHIMDRFYRVEKTRNRKLGGTGLGLAIAKRLVDRYNGSITFQSKEGMGTTVTISFTSRLHTNN